LKESGVNSSKITKREIKNTTDISKLGVGIIKIKKATRGAIVENVKIKIKLF